METDREVLMWFHERLEKVHKESHLLDYMHRLRWIVMSMPRKKTSRGQQKKFKGVLNNSLKEIKIKKPSEFEKQMIKGRT